MPASPWEAIKNMSLRCTVKINGTPMKDEYGIESISISHKIGTLSTAELSISGNYASDFSDLTVADDDIFSPGNPIEITGGYDDKGETILFTGSISSYSIKLAGGNPVSLSLSCKHVAVKMSVEKKTVPFKDKTDSEIISTILGANGLNEFTVEATSIKKPTFLQNEASDWDTILSRAQENGLLVCLDGATISVKSPQLTSEPVIRLASGESIIDFSGELVAESQPTEAKVYAFDDKQTPISATAKEPAMNTQGNLTPSDLAQKFGTLKQSYFINTTATAEELTCFVNNKLLMIRLSAIRGSVSFVGSPLVKTGCLVLLEGVGKRYNGNAFITSVTHSINKGIWKTTANFGLDTQSISDKSGFSAKPASGREPAVQGLLSAKVLQLKKDEQDANSLYKVLVGLPAKPDVPNAVWASIANFYATKGEGLVFLPEIGDDVVVGFLDSSANNPIILGSFYNLTNTAPSVAADNNNYIKSITTKAKLKLSFDDENKVIKIETPNANQVTISDKDDFIEIKDKNNNIIKMNADGIKLTSDKDITIDTKGNLKLSAVSKITLSSSGGDVEISGSNIKHTAQIGFTAKGAASAEVSSSLETTIKGTMVKIN